jgi:PAS domain-containing protein
MPSTFEFCIPARATTVPDTPDWLHEVKYDGYRPRLVLSSTRSGADALPFEHRRRRLLDATSVRQQYQSEFDHSSHPYMVLDPGPGLKIIDVNAAYEAAIARSQVVGKSLFEVFPDNPDDALADGVSNLYASLKIVAETGQPHAMSIQRYDIRNPSGEFVERHWQLINTPIHDKEWTSYFYFAPRRERN